MPSPKYLIINADDYGYFSCVSQGILQGAELGVITATGMMANSTTFDEHLEQLIASKDLDNGVHLNISYGTPLTAELRNRFAENDGEFPNKSIVVKSILMGQIPLIEIENEWRAQIQRCVDSGINIRFLNSHEHLHMLPPLFKVFMGLVHEYQLPFSRYSGPEWTLPMNLGSTIRNSLLTVMHGINATRANKKAPKLIGMNESGKLSLSYFKKAFSALKPGTVYELMCHPGFFDKKEIDDPRLLNYHDWEGELNVLTSTGFAELLRTNTIELVNYRSLASLKN